MTRRPDGLFPSPKEIRKKCRCPDWAGLCKHLAAVLYGVGAHLDKHPELLFLLRDVDHTELVSEAVSAGNLSKAFGDSSTTLDGEDLGAMFGIDLDVSATGTDAEAAPEKRRSPAKKKAVKKKAATKKAATKKAATKKAATKKPATKAPKKKAVRKKAASKKATKKPTVNESVSRKKAVRKRVVK